VKKNDQVIRNVPTPIRDPSAERIVLRAGSGNLNNLDKWKFCLNAA
jgi:hypothetical protein